jgi:hypothetical protein
MINTEKNYDRTVLVRKPEAFPLARPSSRWKNNIKTDIKEIRCEGVDWIQLAQDMVQ